MQIHPTLHLISVHTASPSLRGSRTFGAAADNGNDSSRSRFCMVSHHLLFDDTLLRLPACLLSSRSSFSLSFDIQQLARKQVWRCVCDLRPLTGRFTFLLSCQRRTWNSSLCNTGNRRPWQPPTANDSCVLTCRCGLCHFVFYKGVAACGNELQ